MSVITDKQGWQTPSPVLAVEKVYYKAFRAKPDFNKNLKIRDMCHGFFTDRFASVEKRSFLA